EEAGVRVFGGSAPEGARCQGHGVTPPGDVEAKIREAVARLIGPPGDVRNLRRLTAGATKSTWIFRAQIGNTEEPLVLQASRAASLAAGGGLALPRVAGRDDAGLLIAARESGIPVPRVRAVLTPDLGLGEGCIMDHVDGETIPRRILREAAFARLR